MAMSNEDIQKVAQELIERLKRDAALREEIGRVARDAQIDEVLHEMRALGRRIDQQQNELRALGQRIDEQQNELRALGRRIDEQQNELRAMAQEHRNEMRMIWQELKALREESNRLGRRVAVLEDRYGMALEDYAVDLVQRWAEAEGWQIVGECASRELRGREGRTIEFDIVADLRRDGEEAVVVDAVKSRVDEADVRRFRRRIEECEDLRGRRVVAIFTGRLFRNAAFQVAKESGILAYHLTRRF
jgi:hypothetical protein